MIDSSIALRAFFAYVLLIILARLMRRREIAQMTFFDFIVAITIGGLSARIILETEVPFLKLIPSIIVFTIMEIVTSFFALKSTKFRHLTNGTATVLIKGGKIIERNMLKERINAEELITKLRDKNIFNLADVDTAIFETDGTVSVQKKPEKETVTRSDLNLVVPSVGIPEIVIDDGKLLEENLKKLKLTKSWLISKLSSQGIDSISKVMLAQIDSHGNMYIDLYEEKV